MARDAEMKREGAALKGGPRLPASSFDSIAVGQHWINRNQSSQSTTCPVEGSMRNPPKVKVIPQPT
jgi:hypothetical protein